MLFVYFYYLKYLYTYFNLNDEMTDYLSFIYRITSLTSNNFSSKLAKFYFIQLSKICIPFLSMTIDYKKYVLH